MNERVRLDDFNEIPAAGADPPTPPPWFESAADLLREPDPGPTAWLVEDLVVDQALTAIVGPPKEGKTWALLDLAVAIVTGEKALGRFTVSTPGPVLLVVEEAGRTALHRRLSMIARGRAITPDRLAGLHFAANRRVQLDAPEWQERLREAAQAQPWRLIAFDPFARVKGRVDENIQREVGVVLDFLREVRDLSGAATGYVHHTPHDRARQRGSSDLESYYESKLTLTDTNDGHRIEAVHREAEGAGFRFTVRFDPTTATVRVEAYADELEERVREYRREHPDASGNDVVDALKTNRKRTLEVFKRVKALRGSESLEPPGTTPPAETGSGRWVESPLIGGSLPPAEPVGSTGSESREPPLSDDSGDEDEDDPLQVELDHYREVLARRERPLVGDPGYLDLVFGALVAEKVTEREWHAADHAHRFVEAQGRA